MRNCRTLAGRGTDLRGPRLRGDLAAATGEHGPEHCARCSRAHLDGAKRGGPAPGTIFVANAGKVGGGTGKGSVTAYHHSATGNARPRLVITDEIDGPVSLEFDSSGDLWVASNDNSVVEYGKAELAKASPAPTITLSIQSGGLAFDPSGGLWVADYGRAAIEFTKAQLAKSGSRNSVVTITYGAVCSLVFDPSGDLWEGGPRRRR